jgi:hypothetical protein
MPKIKNQSYDETKGKVHVEEQVEKHVKKKATLKAKESHKML